MVEEVVGQATTRSRSVVFLFFSFEGGRVVVKWQMYKGFRFEPGGYFGPNKLLVMRLL